jgi:D-alanine-D-alanine ligase
LKRKIRVGVIFGGRSGEHEVSLRSGQAVIETIDHKKYEVIPLAITKTGKWLSPAEAMELLPRAAAGLLSRETGEYREALTVVGDPSRSGLVAIGGDGGRPASLPVDVIFPVLHGTFGEDGTIQGLFEMAGVPYVGCGVLASSCGMDKVAMKMLFREAGLRSGNAGRLRCCAAWRAVSVFRASSNRRIWGRRSACRRPQTPARWRMPSNSPRVTTAK